MLAGEESIKVVGETLKKYGIEKTVIDPVCGALDPNTIMIRQQQ